MRSLAISAIAVVFGVGLLANVAEAGKGAKKATTPEKVELKDVPAAVMDATKKELADATFTSAAKSSTKKQGTVYTLQGAQGKYAVSVTLNSSGQLLRLTKRIAGKKQKPAP